MEYIVFLFLKKLKFLIKVHSWITFHYSGEKKQFLVQSAKIYTVENFSWLSFDSNFNSHVPNALEKC